MEVPKVRDETKVCLSTGRGGFLAPIKSNLYHRRSKGKTQVGWTRLSMILKADYLKNDHPCSLATFKLPLKLEMKMTRLE
jgi:hypothetical protein